MKHLVSVVLLMTMLISPVVVHAHAHDDTNSEQLKRQIEQLEGVDLKSKSSPVENIYKQTLLRLYDQYRSALEQELADLRSILNITGNNGSGPGQAVSTIQKLTDERDMTTEKIKTLRGDSETRSAPRQTSDGPEATRVSNSPSTPSTPERPAVANFSLPARALPRFELAATTANPPANENVSASVDWETRTAGCPAKVTAPTSATIRVTHINDLIIDFGRGGEKLDYQLRAKGTPLSAVAPTNLFFGQAGAVPEAKKDKKTEELLAKLEEIRSDVTNNPKYYPSLSPKEAGGPSISLRRSYDTAMSVPNVSEILIQYSQNRDDPIFKNPNAAGHPVFQWLMRINGSHSYDFTVVLEPNQNYEFTLTEKWRGKETQNGRKRWDCGERDIFSMSIGPVISTLPMRTYNHQKALVPPGSSTTQDILVVENSRNISVLGAALLNYHFPRINGLPRSMGFTLSAGPVYNLGKSPEVSSLGLFVGPSLHLNRSLFITPGFHIGQFADFPAGFAPGTVIPDQFGELTPVKRTTAHFAFAITYRTNSFKKSSTDSGVANNAASAGGPDDTSGNTSRPGTTGTGPRP